MKESSTVKASPVFWFLKGIMLKGKYMQIYWKFINQLNMSGLPIEPLFKI